MAALDGVGVLVTRPERQAAPVCRLLEARGATVIRWPVLEINATDEGPLHARVGPIEAFDLIVFTSANAVKFGVPLLEGGREFRLAAVGPATALALQEAGFAGAAMPTAGFDSDGLLMRPELQNVAGKRMLIVKGTLGRDILRERLAERGAHVVVAEVYARERVLHGAADMASLSARLAAREVDVVTVTSVDVADGLLALATPDMRRELERVPWVVPSARVATVLRERGVLAPLFTADSARDQDMVEAVARWRSSVSGRVIEGNRRTRAHRRRRAP